jgi:predicted aspartyl protease
MVLAGCAQGYGCNLVKVAEVPLEPRGRLYTVPVAINGRQIHMLLDTGGRESLLTEATVQRLSVIRDGRTSTVMTGVTGGSLRVDANVESIALGDVPLALHRIPVNSIGVRGIDGILGLDVLQDYELDIDARRRALTLYRVRRCERADPPWDDPATPIEGTSTSTGWLEMPLGIEGIEVAATADTGAAFTTITPRVLGRLGLSERDLANDRTLTLHVIAGEDAQVRVH